MRKIIIQITNLRMVMMMIIKMKMIMKKTKKKTSTHKKCKLINHQTIHLFLVELKKNIDFVDTK